MVLKENIVKICMIPKIGWTYNVNMFLAIAKMANQPRINGKDHSGTRSNSTPIRGQMTTDGQVGWSAELGCYYYYYSMPNVDVNTEYRYYFNIHHNVKFLVNMHNPEHSIWLDFYSL